MIILIVFMFFALYSFYVYKWAQSRLSEEYHFASPSPPIPLPHSPGLSILIGILWGLTIIAGIFWGFYGNPYPDILAWRSSAGDLDLFLLIAICLSVGLSYLVIYRLGEIKGVTSMKNTALFRQFLDKRKIPGSDADTGGIRDVHKNINYQEK